MISTFVHLAFYVVIVLGLVFSTMTMFQFKREITFGQMLRCGFLGKAGDYTTKGRRNRKFAVLCLGAALVLLILGALVD